MCDLGQASDNHCGFLVDTPEIRALIAETERLNVEIPAVASRVDAPCPEEADRSGASGRT